jgi:pilus assembly protein Flp/PilA
VDIIAYWKGMVAPYLKARLSTPERTGEAGAALIEYALLVSLIAVVCLVAVMFLGTSTSQKFSTVGSQLQ